MFNLTQSVTEPTHNQGHLLDLVLSEQNDNSMKSHLTTQLSCANLMYLYPNQSLKPSYTAPSKRSILTAFNISLTLSHQRALSPTTIITFVLSRSSSASWNGSVGRQRDVGSNLNSPSIKKFTIPLNRKLQTLVDKAKKTFFLQRSSQAPLVNTSFKISSPCSAKLFFTLPSVFDWWSLGSLF